MKRVEPGPGQESVWDYPRPPRMERQPALVEVVAGGVVIASTRQSFRVLETSHPPVYYLPPGDIDFDRVVRTDGTSFCEWKGQAIYYDVKLDDGRVIERAAWAYPNPVVRFAELKDHLAFYPSKMDECRVDGEVVSAQEGDFYGGWITRNLVGPFKGAPGTMGW